MRKPKASDRWLPIYTWGVHFAAIDIPGRNGLKRGEIFPSQVKFDIRHWAPGGVDPGVPFSALKHVETLCFPTRHYADRCIDGRLNIVQARALLAEAEAEAAAADAGAVAAS